MQTSLDFRQRSWVEGASSNDAHYDSGFPLSFLLCKWT